MLKTNPPKEALLPIREVSKITGINPITLRAWERRYSLIEPIRTDSGHRLYTHENIITLKEVVRLTQQGVPIGQIKALLDTPKAATVVIPQNEADLESQLLHSLENADIKSINQMLDALLADYPSSFWFSFISKITLTLSKTSSPSEWLWFSLAVPRLMSRLHLSYRQLGNDVRPVWVQGSESSHTIWHVLVALNLVSQGYYPLLQPAGMVNFETLLPALQTLYCHGIAWVSPEDMPDLEAWQHWTHQHPSFALFLFLKQPDLNEFRQMQVQLVDLLNFEKTSL